MKIPKSLGACADLLFDLKQKRIEQQKLVDALKEQEQEVTEYIINNLPKGDTGAMGAHHKAAVVTKAVPHVKDWDAFYKYVSRTKSFDLLQRRLSSAAVEERWTAGKTVAGVEPFNAVSVSLTKI